MLNKNTFSKFVKFAKVFSYIRLQITFYALYIILGLDIVQHVCLGSPEFHTRGLVRERVVGRSLRRRGRGRDRGERGKRGGELPHNSCLILPLTREDGKYCVCVCGCACVCVCVCV